MLDVSLFLPLDDVNPNYVPPNLILYCHCNASNKLECKQYVEYLPKNYGIASFDFLGCGNTKNMYISLGCRESQQIRAVAYALRPMFKRIIPWGRSMGASSVLMYGEAPIMVVDSPYTSPGRVGKDALYGSKSKIPACCVCCLFPCVYCCVRSSVKEKAQYDMSDIDNIKSVRRMSPQQAIIFIVGKDDDIVLPSHSERLYKNFSGRKQMLVVEGTHVTRRKRAVFEEVLRLLDQYIYENDSMMQFHTQPVITSGRMLVPMMPFPNFR